MHECCEGAAALEETGADEVTQRGVADGRYHRRAVRQCLEDFDSRRRIGVDETQHIPSAVFGHFGEDAAVVPRPEHHEIAECQRRLSGGHGMSTHADV